jgi:hypothetical protein
MRRYELEIECHIDMAQEGKSGTIELKAIQSDSGASEEADDSCDDPEIVKLMMEFFYHLDYLPNGEPPSPDLSDSEPELEWKRYAFGPAAKRAVLKKKVRAASPVNESPSATAPQSPTLAASSASVASQKRVYIIEHAKVFAMAVKYQVDGLRRLAAAKFKRSARANWNHDDFAHAISVVHNSTADDVPQLRKIVGDIIYEHFDTLKHKADIDALIRSIPLLAYGMLSRAGTIAGCANGHSGQMTATMCRYCQSKFDICEGCPAWTSCPCCREDMC